MKSYLYSFLITFSLFTGSLIATSAQAQSDGDGLWCHVKLAAGLYACYQIGTANTLGCILAKESGYPAGGPSEAECLEDPGFSCYEGVTHQYVKCMFANAEVTQTYEVDGTKYEITIEIKEVK